MKTLLLCLVCVSVSLTETQRAWQEGVLKNIADQQQGSRTVAIPAPPGYPQHSRTITQVATIYVVDVENMRYALTTGGPSHFNLTIGGKVRIALDGQNAYLLDENGKEHKLTIARKLLKPTASTAVPVP